MLPLLSFVVVGSLAAVALTRARSRVPVARGPQRKKRGRGLPTGTFQIVGQRMVEETERVLATEDVPMDNRFGNQPFVSEHDFFRSARVSIEMDLGRSLASISSAALFSALKAELHTRLVRKLGVEMDAQVSRHVRLRLSAAPGKKVLYQVVWKQTSQRGLFEIGVGRHLYQVPYMMTFGLSHTVRSIEVEDVLRDPSSGFDHET